MNFIGQEHIINQIGDVLPYIKHYKEGVNILFRGPSGYGKTELAKTCAKFLVGDNYQFCLGNKLKFNRETWVHFIDECHLLESPEVLYPVMDMGHYVFLFATNVDSVLPEALTNRCKNYIFVEYSLEELRQIFRMHSKLRYPDIVMDYIIELSNKQPRTMIITFIDTLRMHYRNQENVPQNPEEIIDVINNMFGINGGLDRVSKEYLDTLKRLGGRASVTLLATAANLDVNTMKYQVEPGLLYKGLIKITSKGRELV